MNDEIWKDIEGYSGKYQVSNFGNVRSTYVNRCMFGKYKMKIEKETLLKQIDNGAGYLKVNLKSNGKRKNCFVHRLVAEAFVENKNGYRYVNHIDYNKLNNHSNNLEWCTQKQNILHSIDHYKKPKSRCRKSNTGYKYIHKNNNYYHLHIKTSNLSKIFKTLDEAIIERDKFLNELNNTG